MCNTNRNPNKGKEKVNEESIVNFKTMEIQNNENKRKAIVLVEPDVETNNSKSLNNGDAGEESSNSSKEISPFLLFGFIIDPNKRIRHGYSCNFCNRKFLNPQALGGHQNRHRYEKKLKKRAENVNTMIPYRRGYGYQLPLSSKFDAGNLLADQGIVSPQITMPEVEYGSIPNGGADSDDAEREVKETEKEEELKIDLTLKL